MTMPTRRSMLLSAAGVAVVPALFAQRSGGRGGRGRMMDPEAQLKMYTERLKLSADQQEKVKKLLEEQGAAFRKLRDEARQGGDRSAMREKMMKLREDSDKQMSEILSKEQADEYKKMMEERRSRMRGGGPPPKQ